MIQDHDFKLIEIRNREIPRTIEIIFHIFEVLIRCGILIFQWVCQKIKTLHKSDRNLFMQIPVTNEEIKQKYLMVKFKSHNILKFSRR